MAHVSFADAQLEWREATLELMANPPLYTVPIQGPNLFVARARDSAFIPGKLDLQGSSVYYVHNGLEVSTQSAQLLILHEGKAI